MRYLINLSYDGSNFFGSQKQKDKKTVIGELERVISKIFDEEIKVVGCSRTDRKVHALDYYAHFDSKKEKELSTLKHSINSLIDKSIFIKDIKIVNNLFHSRFDVKTKEYVYKINTKEYDPVSKDYIFQYNKEINISLMKKIAYKIEGKHNFHAFTSDTPIEECIRTINYIKITKEDKLVCIYICASGFLKYMVRNIVGLMLEINEGKKDIEIISKLFKDKNRSDNAVKASPEGLYLNKVNYK